MNPSVTTPGEYKAETEYDQYYSHSPNHPNSIYSELYGEHLIHRLEETLINVALQAAARIQAEGGDTLRMVDFGCGNGRYFRVFKEIAGRLMDMGMNLEVQAYDISSVGLENFKEHLHHRAFKEVAHYQDFIHHTDESKSYRACSMQQDNLTVHFVHGNVAESMRDIGKLIGQVDITAMLFGVLGHVPGRENRQEMMRVLGEISDHAFITTVANSRHVLKAERRFYDDLRTVSHALEALDAPETGAPDSHIRHYEMDKLARVLHRVSPAFYGREIPAFDFALCLRDPQKRGQLQQAITERLGIARDAGDVYYQRMDEGKPVVTNYYHMWTQKELQQDVEAAGLHLCGDKIRAEKLAPEGVLTRHLLRNQLDGFVSRAISGEGVVARLLNGPLHGINDWAERVLPENVTSSVRQAMVSAFGHYFLVVADTRAREQAITSPLICC